MITSLKIQKKYLLLFFIFTAGTNVYSQEWQVWSDWKKSSPEEELSYRQRIKYTTSDTYAVQIEWKNKSEFDIKLEFEVQDRRNIKEIKILTIPAMATKAIYAGTSFKSNWIKVHILKCEKVKPDK